MNIDNFIIKSFDQFTGFNRSTGELEVVMDELNDFTFSQEEEKQDVTGRGGRIIGSIKKNKKVTGKGSNGYLTGGALAALIGCETEEGKHFVKYTDTILIKNNSGSLNKKAVGTAGNEIETIYVRDVNNSYISGGKKKMNTITASGVNLHIILKQMKSHYLLVMFLTTQKLSHFIILKLMERISLTMLILTAKF